jgi:hypothetical protein
MERAASQSGTIQKKSAGWTYVWLCSMVISASLLIAEALYWLAVMVASENPELENRLTGSSGIIVGLFAISFGLSRSWKRLQALEPDSEPAFRNKHKRFNQIAAAFAILCSVAAIAVGAQVGRCDAVISRFIADVKQSQDIMQAIGNARRGANTSIEDYIEMYQSIEPKVAQGRATVSRLRTEIPGCGDFQARSRRFELLLDNLDRRLALLSREIEVAKSIASSPPSKRVRAWQSELVPLADQEASLEEELQTIKQQ